MPLDTIGVAGLEVEPMSAGRQTISFGNEGATMLYLSNLRLEGLSAANAKWRLAPGDTLDFSLLVDGKEIRQPWAAISDAAGGLLRHCDMAERE